MKAIRLTRTVLVPALSLAMMLGCQAQRHKEYFRRMVRAVNARDLAALDDIMAPDYVRHCQATPDVHVSNLDEFKQFLEADFAAVPDSIVTTKWMVAEGDLLAFYCTYAGTQTGQMGPFPPSGRRIDVDFSGVHRFEKGKIAETWLTWDNLTGLMQLGHIPAPNGGGE